MTVKPISNALVRIIDIVLVAGAIIVCAVVFINVIARYVFNFDLAWVNELGETVFLWLTFFGGARAVQSHAHLAVIEFVERMPRKLSRALFVVLWTLTAVILVGMVWIGSTTALANMNQTMSVTGWPVGIAYWSMPVGSLLALFFVVEQIVAGEDFSAVISAAYTLPSEE
jgi:TRAP-type C4-dicarboxylate transport system permease small subunit